MSMYITCFYLLVYVGRMEESAYLMPNGQTNKQTNREVDNYSINVTTCRLGPTRFSLFGGNAIVHKCGDMLCCVVVHCLAVLRTVPTVHTVNDIPHPHPHLHSSLS